MPDLDARLLAFAGAAMIVFGAMGALAGASRNRAAAGAFLGVCLGPVGILLALFLPGAAPRAYRRRPR